MSRTKAAEIILPSSVSPAGPVRLHRTQTWEWRRERLVFVLQGDPGLNWAWTRPQTEPNVFLLFSSSCFQPEHSGGKLVQVQVLIPHRAVMAASAQLPVFKPALWPLPARFWVPARFWALWQLQHPHPRSNGKKHRPVLIPEGRRRRNRLWRR